MLPRLHRLLTVGFLGTLLLAVSFPEAPAQPVAGQPAAEDDGPDVLARGPVHEAFASTVEMPKAGEIAPKAPPDPIEELPPDQKPEGDNVQWIPGYWDWDDERTDFIWISGFWRVPPPNHVWVPGSWNKVTTGYQWTSGFWQLTQPNQAQPELEYLPPPPQPIEVGPSTLAPDDSSVYVTGSWVWRNRYVWRPGYWIAHRPGWLWTPSYYRWTPLGYVFINGYWDYPLASRGVLFAPVYYPRRVFAPGYYYTPRYVIATQLLFGSMFIRQGYSSYYFGDYYGANYGRFGYQPWCASSLGFAIPGLTPRRWNYDPLWNYYSTYNRQNQPWVNYVTGGYAGRYNGTMPRPPRTLAQQNQVIQRAANINNVSNVTNNITVVNNSLTVNNKDVSDHVMVTPLAVAPKLQAETKLQPISQQVRQADAKFASEIRQGAVNRQKAEAEALKSRPPMGVPAPGAAPAAPVKVKIDVPKGVVERAHVPDAKRPVPPAPVLPKFDPKVEPPKVANPKIDPTPTPKGKVDPVPTPKGKVDPVPTPKGKVDPPPTPKSKVDPEPKGKVDPPKPKIDPPKVDPPKPPVVPPKVDPPRPPVVPPKVDPPKPPVVPPKVDPPKPPVVPPKVDPPKPPVVPPKVDPPKPPVVPPKVDPPKPKVDPPKVDPPKPPVVQSRPEPPRQPVVQTRPEPPRQPVVQPRPEPPRQPAAQPRNNPPARPAAQPRVFSAPRAPAARSQPPAVRSSPQPARGNSSRRR